MCVTLISCVSGKGPCLPLLLLTLAYFFFSPSTDRDLHRRKRHIGVSNMTRRQVDDYLHCPQWPEGFVDCSMHRQDKVSLPRESVCLTTLDAFSNIICFTVCGQAFTHQPYQMLEYFGLPQNTGNLISSHVLDAHI